MRNLSSLIALVILCLELSAQSPHGKDFSTNCGDCHTTEGWKIDRSSLSFKHDTTGFPLVGQHKIVDCRLCHKTLLFSQTRKECMACHTDIHEQTVGFECGRCHTPNSWIVENITGVHQQSRFPLVGAHVTADCYDCHPSASNLRFDPLGIECYDCHQDDYQATTNPNHVAAAFSTDCSECHFITSFTWTGGNFNHSFFPLTDGHAINDCFQCHTEGSPYSDISSECVSCHQADYDNTENPNHTSIGFPTDCALCHSTIPGWKPADYREHDAIFPIYSGEHNGEWTSCSECHPAPENYTIFTCTNCHDQGETDEEHDEVGGYIYEDQACLDCHPMGSAEDSFDHNASNFPLTGAHLTTECGDCHANGFSGTPTICFACHEADFNESLNPNHVGIGIPNTCETCHTTDPDWQPAIFPIHNDYYQLNGAHAVIAPNCFTCHEGNYVNTPNLCYSCHTDDYNQSSNPPHESSGFSTSCETCHTETAWTPATFDHDGQFFPIYSGKHQGEWNVCADCHTIPTNYGIFSCIDCHEHNQADTDEEHSDIGGYAYNSPACYECHPTGDAEGSFNHNSSGFPLTGAHLTTPCLECHANGYSGTPTICFACHEPDFTQSVNPNHVSSGIPNDCALCHTTNPDWQPATFPIHNDYYPLNGAHATIANNCFTCHEGNYISTPNLCYSCHSDDYNQTSDPNHIAAQFPTECESCHSETAWTPATFDHDGQFFPIYSGEHNGEWNSCSECHTDPNNYAIFTCLTCHEQGETGQDHEDVGGYIYDSPACLACHPDGSASGSFNHNSTSFPLTGAHLTTDCLECHAEGYAGTPTICFACHEPDFDQSVNPNHVSIGIPNDCALCHTTNPDWQPATFPIHNDYYPLNGAHATIANNCFTCHEGNYINTPNLCYSCHSDDYNQTTDPNHIAAQFPTECESCHSETAWEPATFDHDGQYFPIYSGEHNGEWDNCSECHTDPGNFAIFTCLTCHEQGETDEDHQDVGGYQYNSPACLECHPDGSAEGSFNHNNSNFPLTGAHVTTDCIECHAEGYAGTPTVCFACHEGDFNLSVNPNHNTLGIPNDCETCHTTDPGWQPALFPIHDNYYPLTGEHLTVAADCYICHEGDYNGTPNTCAGCHMDNYNASSNPDHDAISIPTECETCHTTAPDWQPASFPIHNDYWPLTGAHLTISEDCFICHEGDYNSTPNACVGCHLDDYSGSSNPDHDGIGIGTDCETCHTTNPDWEPASFPIHNNYWPLTGAHLGIASDCDACHGGNYNSTPNECAGCHMDDFNGTNDPDHQTAGFPTTCEDCHTTVAWVPSTFDHDGQYFPIYSGSHSGEWNTCSECHPNPSDFGVFTCLTCHEQAETNGDHSDVTGYSYNSDACYACHPNGEEEAKKMMFRTN